MERVGVRPSHYPALWTNILVNAMIIVAAHWRFDYCFAGHSHAWSFAEGSSLSCELQFWNSRWRCQFAYSFRLCNCWWLFWGIAINCWQSGSCSLWCLLLITPTTGKVCMALSEPHVNLLDIHEELLLEVSSLPKSSSTRLLCIVRNKD